MGPGRKTMRGAGAASTSGRSGRSAASRRRRISGSLAATSATACSRNWDRKKTAEVPKTAWESQREPVSPIGLFSGNSREHAGRAAKTLGLVVGCSRLFPAVHGTGDRKRTAGEALRSVLRSLMPALTRNPGAGSANSTPSRRISGGTYRFVRIGARVAVLEPTWLGRFGQQTRGVAGSRDSYRMEAPRWKLRASSHGASPTPRREPRSSRPLVNTTLSISPRRSS